MRTITVLAIALTVTLAPLTADAKDYSWQKPHAEVIETGDLRWAPEPFEFVAGEQVRYIDYEGGDDGNDGLTRETAWKHHPWDSDGTQQAAGHSGPTTYVFKRGVAYRGRLNGDELGQDEEPIRLTSDPAWGRGDASLYGSVRIETPWRKASEETAPEGMPEPSKVWCTELPEGDRPWTLWQIADGEVVRLPLARTPNWKVSEPLDVMSKWWEWGGEAGVAEETIEGRERLNYGRDPERLTLPAEAYEQGFVYTEWGPVMGTPAAREVVKFHPETSTIYFGGFWGGPGQRIFSGNRYYLENSPYFLDEAGEWWVDEERNRLYLRLPEDGDPNEAHLEAGRAGTLIDLASGTENVEISGLSFRFTNVGAPNLRPFTPETDVACVRLKGSGKNLRVSNCRFEHINTALKMKAAGDHDLLDEIVVSDNVIAYTDHGALDLEDGSHWGLREPPKGVLGSVSVLRNKLDEIGRRPPRGENGHAVNVRFPLSAHIAGNVLDRCYGAGLFIFGGKPSGYRGDAPFSRIVIHHNKVTNPLLRTNDWGGIETWQGGPHYVYNNVSGNPWGYWHWAQRHFGFAYYMDGSFKNYQFNNIAWGTSSAGTHANTSAFQEIISYQNTVFNNSIFRFGVGTRRQAPQAGRDLYLANIWQDIGRWYFWHARPARSPAEANQAHVGNVGEQFAYPTMGYARNVFAGASRNFGVFEANGMPHASVDSMSRALGERGALAAGVGVAGAVSPYRDAEGHDFRLRSGTPAVGSGVKVFAPWSLYAMVGEWNFHVNRDDPTQIIDDHWYMTAYHVGRGSYYKRPMYPLRGVNVGAEDYRMGELEDWTRSALRLDGRSQYAVLENERLMESFRYEIEVKETEWLAVTLPTHVAPGQMLSVELTLNNVPGGRKVGARLYGEDDGPTGDYVTPANPPRNVRGEGPYPFEFTAPTAAGQQGYLLVVFLSPTGEWEDRTREASIEIGRVDEAGSLQMMPRTPRGGRTTRRITVSGEELRNPQIHTSNFLIEAVIRPERGAEGVLVSKMADVGYMLSVKEDGAVSLGVKGKNGEAAVRAAVEVNDGEWHHVVAEVDRQAGRMTIYVDGEEVAGGRLDLPPGDSLVNEADLLVGRGPEDGHLAVTLDFLRIARGTLADAHTTIDELYQWQFNGPFLRDFTGSDPVGRRDAGAIELMD